MHDELATLLKIERSNFIEYLSENKEDELNLYRVCPKCGESNDIIKFGRFKRIQRYQCKMCSKTFSDVTNTPFYRSKKPLAYWLVYAKLMLSGMTIRQSAKMTKINVATAFYWRHKILDSMFFLENKENLSDEIQISDTFFPDSHKGEKGKVMEKRSNRVGGKLGLRNYVSVLCLIDGKDKIVLDPICRDVFWLYGIEKWLDKRIVLEPNARFISSVNKFDNKLAIKMFKNKIRKGKFEETYRGRNLAKSLKTWIGEKFRGVATKYLNNYLVWFKYNMAGKFKTYKEFLSKNLNILMSLKSMPYSVSRVKDYRNKAIILYGTR